MSSRTLLFLFGVLIFVAFVAAFNEEEMEDGEISELSPVKRFVRNADSKKGKKKGKKGKGNKGNARKKGRKVGGKKKKGGRKNGASKKNKSKNNGGKNPNKETGKGKAKAKGSSRKSGRQNEEKPPVASKCYNQAVFYMKQMLNVVANFDKQYKRIKAQTKTGGNKADKKGAFAAIAANLVNIGGGNKDKLSCAGSDSNDGAKQLSNLTSTLFDCEKMINDSCNSNNFPQSNMTLTDECVKNTKMFSDTVKTCLKETTDEGACKCWTNAELEKTSMAIKDCKMSDQASAVKNKLDECKKAFGKCRKYQDAAGDAISACSQETSKLTKDAAKLNSNKNAMEKANAKIKALASFGIGRRSVRQVATSCAQVIAKATQLAAVATANPSGDQVATLANEISEVSATVECNAVEKISLTVTSNALDIAIAIVTTAFNAIQNLIATIVGTPAPPSSLTTGSSSATAASSGRRERLYKDLMIKNMI